MRKAHFPALAIFPSQKNPGNRSQTVWGSGRIMYDHVVVVVVVVDDDDNDDDDEV